VHVPEVGDIGKLLPARGSNTNKGSFGRVLFVGGSRDFLGAPALSSIAAYRAGAGLVEVATLPSVQQNVAAHALEPIFAPLPEEDGRISPGAEPHIRDRLQQASALVYGPGMGLSESTVRLTHHILSMVGRAKLRGAVIDADGLNALAQIDRWWEVEAPLVLTPHPGEMGRLTGLSVPEVQRDRVRLAQGKAREWGKVVVLKGAGTVVASPSGTVAINLTGGPNLASAGTGDVLSGIIGGLLAQGCPPWEAAVAGVYLHGRAGDELREKYGDAGTLAGDLLPVIPLVRRSILEEAEEST
jgi:NAD(P)H-hydrate epimerase